MFKEHIEQVLKAHRAISDTLIATEKIQEESRDKVIKYLEHEVILDTVECCISRLTFNKSGVEVAEHIHRKGRQTFICISGLIMLTINETSIVMSPTTPAITIPPNTPHKGISVSDDGVLLTICVPADTNITEFSNELRSRKVGLT